MKKLIIIFLIISLSFDVYASYYFDDSYNNVKNPWTEIAKDGVFDVSDGDLEDKIGDFGIYGDLFPDEVKDDYKEDNSYTKKNNDYSNSELEKKIKKQTGRTAPKKYKGKWEKECVKSEWVRRRNGYYEWEYSYLWKFYPNGSSKCLVNAWAVIDDKLYSFDEDGFMFHDTKDSLLSNNDLYAMSDGAYCRYKDYKKNKDKADTYYKNVISKNIKIQ